MSYSRIAKAITVGFYLVVVSTVFFGNQHNQRHSDQDAEEAIAELLQSQVACWNRGDIDGFMDTYWESEELTFCSSGKITRGWRATKERYKKNYVTPEKMGHLDFDDLEITLISDNAALVIGTWKLSFSESTGKSPISGKYSLVLKVIDKRWKIIHDHTSVAE